jgi:hypothetical protein
MDREFMMKDENANNFGESFDAAIFARVYRIKVVLYLAQNEESHQTQLYDCSQFNQDKNVGLVFSAKNGLHPETVPAGPNVLQLITYFTDTEDTPGGGAKHWIRVATPTEPYEPEQDLGNTVDYGIVELESEIEGGNKNDKTLQENIREMALELKGAKDKKVEEDRKKKKKSLEREKEKKEDTQQAGSILAVMNPLKKVGTPPMVTQAGEEEPDEKESESATESKQNQ